MIKGTLREVSNAETWLGDLEFVDNVTGAAWFLQGNPPDEITLKVRDPDTKSTLISGSLTGGDLVVTGDGVVRFTFTDITALAPKTYEVGGLYTDNSVVTQFFLGFLPVLEGL